MKERNSSLKLSTVLEYFKGQFKDHSAEESFLPEKSGLGRLLGLQSGAAIEDLIGPALLDPVKNITDRPGKRIRAQLVQAGFELAASFNSSAPLFRRHCRRVAEIIEFIHAGSLVVDDIQDGSKMRRGKPALHRQYGLPVALNAGNWLYFWPFELIRAIGLPKDKEITLYRAYHQTLLRAHFGQALDVGVKIDSLEQGRIADVCVSAIELKTGALAGFAFASGGILAGASEGLLAKMSDFGNGFGVALQMFDDLGNLSERAEPVKRFEDLSLRRPSWVWACAARHFPRPAFLRFVAAVERLPETQYLEDWLAKNDLVSLGRKQAHEYFESVFAKLTAQRPATLRFHPRTLRKLRELGRQVSEAYD